MTEEQDRAEASTYEDEITSQKNCNYSFKRV